MHLVTMTGASSGVFRPKSQISTIAPLNLQANTSFEGLFAHTHGVREGVLPLLFIPKRTHDIQRCLAQYTTHDVFLQERHAWLTA